MKHKIEKGLDIFEKIELTLDKYEKQLMELLNSLKECEIEEQKIIGRLQDEVR